MGKSGIKIRKVKELKFHPLNDEMYYLSDLQDLRLNIKENGLLVPLVVDQQNQVISGNRRLKCLIDLGIKEVQVLEFDIKEEDDVKFLIYSYNKQRRKRTGEIINEILMLKEYYSVGSGYKKHINKDGTYQLKDWRKSVSNELGISTGTIEHYLTISKHPEYWEDIDNGNRSVSGTSKYVNTLIKKEIECQVINFEDYKRENFRIYNKSSEFMDDIKDGEVQTIFTSPPFYGLRVYGKKGLGNEVTSQEFIENLSRHLDDCYRVLNKQGSLFLNLGDTWINGCLQNVPHRVVMEMMKRKGWILKNSIIWSKPNPKPNPTKRGLAPTYEFIFHLVKSLDYKYKSTDVPTKGFGKKSSRPKDRSENYYKDNNTCVINEFKNMGDFITEDILRVCVSTQNKFKKYGGDHPAVFPENIVTPFILQTSDFGDLILDPFMGSGTTLDVGLQLGRRVVGYEINSYYCDLVKQKHEYSLVS